MAILIPGVSVSTMACVLGMHQRLIFITNDFFSAKIPEKGDLSFLFLLGIGIVICLTFMSAYMRIIIQNYSQFLFPFLLGMSVSSVVVSPDSPKQKFCIFMIAAVTTTLVYSMKTISIAPVWHQSNISLENYSSTKLIFWSALAMCFSLLPGLSGSLVLVLSGFLGILHRSIVNVLSIEVTLLDIQLWVYFFLGVLLGGYMGCKLLVYCYQSKNSWIQCLTNGVSMAAIYLLFASTQNFIALYQQTSIMFLLGVCSLQLLQYLFGLVE